MKTGMTHTGNFSSNIPVPGLKSCNLPLGERSPSGNQTRFFFFFRTMAPKARLDRAARVGSTGKIFPSLLKKRNTGLVKRSEERRVGKECKYVCAGDRWKRKAEQYD